MCRSRRLRPLTLLYKILQAAVGLALIAFAAGAYAIYRRRVAAFCSGQEMVDRIPKSAAKKAGVAVPFKNVAAKSLVAIEPADRMAVHNDRSMLSYQCFGQLQVDLLVPAAAFIRTPAHPNLALTVRAQHGGCGNVNGLVGR